MKINSMNAIVLGCLIVFQVGTALGQSDWRYNNTPPYQAADRARAALNARVQATAAAESGVEDMIRKINEAKSHFERVYESSVRRHLAATTVSPLIDEAKAMMNKMSTVSTGRARLAAAVLGLGAAAGVHAQSNKTNSTAATVKVEAEEVYESEIQAAATYAEKKTLTAASK